MGKVVMGGRMLVLPLQGVVDVAQLSLPAAAGESAGFIPNPEKVTQVGGDTVPVPPD